MNKEKFKRPYRKEELSTRQLFVDCVTETDCYAGKIEGMEAILDSLVKSTSRLVETLYNKGLLSRSDVKIIVSGYDFNEEE